MDEPRDFSVSVGFREGFRILVVRGDLDEVTAPELERLLSAGDGRRMIVDLTPLASISSTGIHLLLREPGTPAALVCPPRDIARLFGLVRIGGQMLIFDDLDQAVRSFHDLPAVASGRAIG